MQRRRRFVSTVAVSLTAVLGGCQTTSESTETTVTENQEESPDGRGGGRPPWMKESSDADLVVSNATEERLQVEIKAGGFGGFEETVELGANDDWVSGNVIPSGETTTVSVSTDSGLSTSSNWKAESDNSKVLVHVVTDEKIRKHTGQKNG